MYNAKVESSRQRSGCISYILGERKYFGGSLDQILDGKKGYYGNVHAEIQSKLK